MMGPQERAELVKNARALPCEVYCMDPGDGRPVSHAPVCRTQVIWQLAQAVEDLALRADGWCSKHDDQCHDLAEQAEAQRDELVKVARAETAVHDAWGRFIRWLFDAADMEAPTPEYETLLGALNNLRTSVASLSPATAALLEEE